MQDPEILFEYASRKERLYETDLLCIQAGLEEARLLGPGQPRSSSTSSRAR